MCKLKMTVEADHTTKDAKVSTVMRTDTDTAITTTDVIPEPVEAEVTVRRYTGTTDTKKTVTLSLIHI